MECADHPNRSAAQSCVACKKALCEACATYMLDDEIACEACGTEEEARARALGSGIFALVGVGYLATLAIGVVVFRSRPFVGGIAAIVAIALGRALALLLPSKVAERRVIARDNG